MEVPTTAEADSTWSRKQTIAAYAATGAAYIVLGSFFKEVFAWWTYAAIFALAVLCGVPFIWRRLR